ncbi:hypothetical protein JD844_001063 [Phrynosoma platyrhinos]|uniref:Vomeronasal type 2 receptor n=1 Tax=Phrynosoma platyrhinos TaxID=52577 RepID=A0ABQ7T9N4_PHRPL|nr:hypothetical protein JD844_001063 [Phrynosoma platyrhinos]
MKEWEEESEGGRRKEEVGLEGRKKLRRRKRQKEKSLHNSIDRVVTKFYQHILSLVFAIKEINENPNILPNVTLGFNIYDSYNDAHVTYRTTLELLFKSHRLVLNYKCESLKEPLAIIGAHAFKTSSFMENILTLYKIPQLTYGSFTPTRRGNGQLSSFYRMATNEEPQYMGIISLLQHFGWTWIGLFVVDDDSGEHFLEKMELLLSQNGICSAFTSQIQNQEHFHDSKARNHRTQYLYQIFKSSKARVFLLYGNVYMIMWIWYFITQGALGDNNKVWITAAQSDFVLASLDQDGSLQMFQGALSFRIHSSEVPGFQEFLQAIKPDWTEADYFLKDFWEEAFDCSVPDPKMPYKVSGTCMREKRLESLIAPLFELRMSGHSYGIYNAIYAVAHASHALFLSRSIHKSVVGKRGALQDLQPWELHPFLQDISFNNSAGESISFNAKREMRAGFDVMNLVTFPNNSFINVKVGWVDPNAPKGKELIIHEDMITWHRNFNQVHPISACTDSCHLGYQKRKKEGEKFCCYDCVPCPEGKISNQTGGGRLCSNVKHFAVGGFEIVVDHLNTFQEIEVFFML